MRTAWVHSSYMHALDTDVLASALELQDELLGTTIDFNPRRNLTIGAQDRNDSNLSLLERDAIHALNGVNNQSWFFHSPLQYWGGSRDRILADPDILATVNHMKNLSTTVNVTLRHSTVFSGKRFKDRRLLAADALVITLFHLADSPVGRRWEQKAAALAAQASDKWDVYPSDGLISKNSLYEFQFRPISAQDSVTLGLAYGVAVVYFLLSLSKVRAVKSKVGLIVTVVTQICFTIMSSFTICAIFKIDLSRIPRAAYPLVMLAMSEENIFRLINAVIQTPSEDSTANRIGHAVGETGPIALASSLQNVLILVFAAQVLSPGVSAFCVFLAVAIVFDMFYLSTFFLSVLSVDVRRTELSDALAKASQRQRRDAVDPRNCKTWLEQLLHGKTPVSTRIAGTFVMIGFILIAQWHFFDRDTVLDTTIRLLRLSDPRHGISTAESSLLDSLHQARSPHSWLRLQDHETAREVIEVIKPTAHSYIAQVYDPLVFVQKGSDRTPRSTEPPLLPAAYDFINHQMTQFVLFVVVVVAALRLLTSYLLWENDLGIEPEIEDTEISLLSIKPLPERHTIDIAMLSNTVDGQVISVGLDRLIRIWDVRSGSSSYTLAERSHGDNIFPVLALATDHESKWLALLGLSRVVFWNLNDREWGPSLPVDASGHRPEVFCFLPNSPPGVLSLVLLRRDGTLAVVTSGSDGPNQEFVVSSCPLQSAVSLVTKGGQCAALPLGDGLTNEFLGQAAGKKSARLHIMAISKKGTVHLASRDGTIWSSHEISLAGFTDRKAHQAVSLPQLGAFLVATKSQVHIVDIGDLTTVHTFDANEMRPHSLQCAFTVHRFTRLDTLGLKSFTLSYVEAATGDCIFHTYTPCLDADAIHLQSKSSSPEGEGCQWTAVKEMVRRVKNPGQHSVLGDGSVVGIRHNVHQSHDSSTLKCTTTGTLRRRSKASPRSKESIAKNKEPPVEWEAWTASSNNRAEADDSQPLFKDGEQNNHLLITQLGPKVRVGLMSVAFCFGNVIKLVTVGGFERFDAGRDDATIDGLLKVGNRRRKMGATPRSKG